MKNAAILLIIVTLFLGASWLWVNNIKPNVPTPVYVPEVLATDVDAFLIYNGQETTVEIVTDSNATIRDISKSGYTAMTTLIWGMVAALGLMYLIVRKNAKKRETAPLSFWDELAKKPKE